MNLMRSVFDFRLFRQNFRSCQGALLITALIYQAGMLVQCFSLSQRQSYDLIVDFSQLSGVVSVLACFLFPIAVSMLLFDFLFSRKKSDLLFSSPVPRRTLYLTNLIGGAGFLMLNVMLATVMVHVTLLQNPQLVTDDGLAARFLILWGLAQLMVYAFSCLAVSLTGNRFVQLTLVLVLILLPGWLQYTAHSLFYSGADLDYSKRATETLTEPLYTRIPQSSSTLETIPYIAFSELTGMPLRMDTYYSADSYAYTHCPVMIVETLAASLLGLVAFQRRRVEVAETSFISEGAHEGLRIALFTPIFYTLGMHDWFSALLYGGILLILYHLYDYLAHREVVILRRTVLSFLAVVLAACMIRFPIRMLIRREAGRQIELAEVEAVSVVPMTSSMALQQSPLLQLKLADPQLISLIFQSGAQTPDYTQDGASYYVRFYEDSGSSDFMIYFNADRRRQLENVLAQNMQYQSLYRDIGADRVKQIQLNGSPVTLSQDQIHQLTGRIQQEVQQQEFTELLQQKPQIACRDMTGSSLCYFTLSLISFEAGERVEQSVDLFRYQSVFQMYGSFVNTQFIQDYGDRAAMLEYYSMYDTEVEDLREASGLSDTQFNQLLTEYLQLHLPTQLTQAPVSSDEYLYLSYYDSQRRQQGVLFVARDENWRQWLQQIGIE